MEKPQIWTTRTSRVWLEQDGIIRKEFLEGAEEKMSDALECGDIIRQLCRDKRRPLLVDFTRAHSIDADARAYYSGPEAGPMIMAVAGITRSRFGKVIGNFFLGFNKPPTPGRLFNTEQEALSWLKGFL